MNKFVRSLALFLAGVPLLASKSTQAATPGEVLQDTLRELGAVSLRPLNLAAENRFAGHRSHSSHSSHASHASHYSGSGGGYAAPPAPTAPPTPSYLAPTPAPAPAPARANRFMPLEGATGASAADTGRHSATPGSEPPVELTRGEALKLQITRVQIKLHMLGLYEGPIDGIRSPATIAALKQFQMVKGLPQDGLMSTPTLNALGIRAVQ